MDEREFKEKINKVFDKNNAEFSSEKIQQIMERAKETARLEKEQVEKEKVNSETLSTTAPVKMTNDKDWSQTDSNSRKPCHNKPTKKRSRLAWFNKKFGAVASLVLIVGLSFGLLFYFLPNNDGYENGPPDQGIQRVQHFNEFISSVDPFFAFDISSTQNITNENLNNFVIVNSFRGEPQDIRVEGQNGSFRILPPAGGYSEGRTYAINLTNARFAEECFKDQDELIFSVEQEEFYHSILRNNVVIIEDMVAIYLGQYRIQVDDPSKFSIGGIYIVDVMMEGVVISFAYRIMGIQGDILSVQIPYLNEVYEELEMNMTFDIDDDMLDMDELHDDIYYNIANSEPVVGITARLFNSNRPTINFGARFQNGDWHIQATVTWSKQVNIRGIPFTVTAYIKPQIRWRSNVGVQASTNDEVFEPATRTETIYTITIGVSISHRWGGGAWSPEGDDDISRLKSTLENAMSQETGKGAIRILNKPKPVGKTGLVIRIALEVRLTIVSRASIEATLGLRVADETRSVEINGTRRVLTNRTTEFIPPSIRIEGYIEARVGLSLGVHFSLLLLVEVGLEIEVGLYARIAGVFYIPNLLDISGEGVHGAAYFELGIYAQVSLVGRIFIWRARVDLLEVRWPILRVGYTRFVTLEAVGDSIILERDTGVSLPNFWLNSMCILTGDKEQILLRPDDYRLRFEVNHNNVIINNQTQMVHLTNPHIETINTTINVNLRILESPSTAGWFVFELGNLRARTSLSVTLAPIAIQSLTLGFSPETVDPNFANVFDLTQDEIVEFSPREMMEYGMLDFQIGRLVRVSPRIYPLNASFRELEFDFGASAPYIMSYRTFWLNGTTHLEFRIRKDHSLVGREITISARSVGYTGQWSDMNVTSTTTQRIIITEIPVVSFEVGVVVDGVVAQQNTAQAGDVIDFAINSATVFPAFTTRSGFESVEVVMGYAQILEPQAISLSRNLAQLFNETLSTQVLINDNAPVGSQITIRTGIGSSFEYFFITVLKRVVQDIEISTTNLEVLPGQSRNIDALITGEDGITPSITEALFIVLQGAEITTLTQTNDANAIINISLDASYGDIVRVVAIIDGLRSNILDFVVTRIPVTNVTISVDSINGVASTNNVVELGDIINLNAIISPIYATFANSLRFAISSGHNYASINSFTGELRIGYGARGGETISVVAIADGVVSNEIEFEIIERPVLFVEFALSFPQIQVRAGTSIMLTAHTNSDASNQNIMFEIISGDSFGQVNQTTGQLLTLPTTPNNSQIIVRAVSVANSTIYNTISISVANHTNSFLSVDGQIGTAYVIAGRTHQIVFNDENGNAIALEGAFRFDLIQLAGGGVLQVPTSVATVTSNGVLTVATIISNDFSITSTTMLGIFASDDGVGAVPLAMMNIQIVIPPRDFYLLYDNRNYATLKATERISIDLVNTNADLRAYAPNKFEFFVNGPAQIFVSSRMSAPPLVHVTYSVSVLIDPLAEVGSIVEVYGHFFIGNQRFEINSFTITVERTVQSVQITNVPNIINIGQSVQLSATAAPFTNKEISFRFREPHFANWATLTSTGYLTINNNSMLVGTVISIEATVDGVNSKVYNIRISNRVQTVDINVNHNLSHGAQFIEPLDFYILNPNGALILGYSLVGGDGSQSVVFVLCAIGQQHLVLNDNIITIRENAIIRRGLNASVVAMSDGQISDAILIYIPAIIRTVADFYDIRNNIGGYFVLANDIDFEGEELEMIPLFLGILDGAGFSLRNFIVRDVSERGNVGVFEENHGVIMNLNIFDVDIRIDLVPQGMRVYVGALVARNYGFIDNVMINVGIQNLFRVFAQNSSTGILVGYNSGYITNARVSAFLNSEGYTGGIAGHNSGTISGAINNFTLTTLYFDIERGVAGIVGRNDGTVENYENRSVIFCRYRQISFN